MEFKPLSQDLEWEARRIAAAFGVQESPCHVLTRGSGSHTFFLESDLTLEVQTNENVIDLLQVGRGQGGFCEVFKDDDTSDWNVVGEPQAMRNFMARALYCLGFEDEGVFADLKCLLTAHEKVEFSLWMPREFWPDTWKI